MNIRDKVVDSKSAARYRQIRQQEKGHNGYYGQNKTIVFPMRQIIAIFLVIFAVAFVHYTTSGTLQAASKRVMDEFDWNQRSVPEKIGEITLFTMEEVGQYVGKKRFVREEIRNAKNIINDRSESLLLLLLYGGRSSLRHTNTNTYYLS